MSQLIEMRCHTCHSLAQRLEYLEFERTTLKIPEQVARIYLLAYTDSKFMESMDIPQPSFIDPKKSRRRQFTRAIDAALPADDYAAMPRDSDDVARGMDGLKATGNGWVPAMAAGAIYQLCKGVKA